jgi:hypothetical protein
MLTRHIKGPATKNKIASINIARITKKTVILMSKKYYPT